MVAKLTAVLEVVQTLPEVRPCARCTHFARPRCAVWNDDVPEANQATGCDRWDDECVPF